MRSTWDFPLVAEGLGTGSGGAEVVGPRPALAHSYSLWGGLLLQPPHSQGKKHKPKPGLLRKMVERPLCGVAHTNPGTLAALLVFVHQFQEGKYTAFTYLVLVPTVCAPWRRD